MSVCADTLGNPANSYSPERRRIVRRENDQLGTGFCGMHEHMLDMVEITRKTAELGHTNIRWLVKLGGWALAAFGAALVVLSGVAMNISHRYAEEMRIRDAARSVISSDLQATNKLLERTVVRLDILEKHVFKMDEWIKNIHYQGGSGIRRD